MTKQSIVLNIAKMLQHAKGNADSDKRVNRLLKYLSPKPGAQPTYIPTNCSPAGTGCCVKWTPCRNSSAAWMSMIRAAQSCRRTFP